MTGSGTQRPCSGSSTLLRSCPKVGFRRRWEGCWWWIGRLCEELLEEVEAFVKVFSQGVNSLVFSSESDQWRTKHEVLRRDMFSRWCVSKLSQWRTARKWRKAAWSGVRCGSWLEITVFRHAAHSAVKRTECFQWIGSDCVRYGNVKNV